MNEKAMYLTLMLENLEDQIFDVEARKIRLDGEKDYMLKLKEKLEHDLSLETDLDEAVRSRMWLPEIKFNKAIDAQKFVQALKRMALQNKYVSARNFMDLVYLNESRLHKKDLPIYSTDDFDSLRKWGWLDLSGVFVSKGRYPVWNKETGKIHREILYTIDIPEGVLFKDHGIEVENN